MTKALTLLHFFFITIKTFQSCQLYLVFTSQAHKGPKEDTGSCKLSKPEQNTGYKLVIDSPEPVKSPAPEPLTNTTTSASTARPVLNGDTAVTAEERSDQEDEDDISLDSLLQRSREYVRREQHQQECRAVRTVTRTPPPQTVQESRCCSPPSVQFGFSLRHSPVGPPHPGPPQQQLQSQSQPERYAQLPRPELSTSPRPQRRKPRPVSAGNIPFTFPIGTADVTARHLGRFGEGDGAATRLESLRSGEVDVGGAGDRSGRPGPVQEAQGFQLRSSPKVQHEYLSTGFRRRSHTLDSHQVGAEHVDRSQERVPRLMAGATWMPPSRRPPAPSLNESYTVVNASPFLPRHHVGPELGEEEPARTCNGLVTPNAVKSAAEMHSSIAGEFRQVDSLKQRVQKSNMLKYHTHTVQHTSLLISDPFDLLEYSPALVVHSESLQRSTLKKQAKKNKKKNHWRFFFKIKQAKRVKENIEMKQTRLTVFVLCTDEDPRCTHMLEGMQRRLEEEHALQMALLMAQQEREQQRLCLVRLWHRIFNCRCFMQPMHLYLIDSEYLTP